jgi:hypothetical protein
VQAVDVGGGERLGGGHRAQCDDPAEQGQHQLRAQLGLAAPHGAGAAAVPADLGDAGGALLSAFTISLAGHALPSLTGYRVLFVVCAAAALLAGVIGLVVSTGPASSHQHEAVTA